MFRVLISAAGATVILVAACTTNTNAPGAPTPVAAGASVKATGEHEPNHNAAAHEPKGYITGWVNGDEVQLYYTKSYFCEEPPDSAAPSHCEIGAEGEVAPRGGTFPIIYAIAAAGIPAPPSTLACAAGTPCLNHPLMIDASRVGGSPQTGPVPHSHVLTERRAGWHHTVNIRVRDLGAWNQIAAAKTLDKVRELQADPTKVTADTPTNIYFFIASWKQ